MKKALQRLSAYWFAPMPAQRLALLRIASGAFALWYLLTRHNLLMNVARTEKGLFEPVGLVAFLEAPLSAEVFTAIYWFTIVLGAAYLLGWKYRYTALPFAVLTLFVFCYRNSWSMIYHDNVALVLHIFIIAFAPAADAHSLDARQRSLLEAVHWQYGWPVRLLCAATALTYFVSGVAKILGDLAWSWMDGSALRSQVAVDSLRKELLGESTSAIFPWLYAHSEIFLLMGIFTLVVELGAPFFLVSRRLRVGWALATWGMHWGIWLVMSITFRYQLTGLIFLPFFTVEKVIPWGQRLGEALRQRLTGRVSPASAVVLFDGVCHFCHATVRFIAQRDPAGIFHFGSLQSAAAQALLRQHGIPTVLSSLVLIENGKAYTRSTAALRIARRLSGFWPVLYYLFIGVPRPLRDALYDAFARRRYAWFGQYETCPAPTPTLRQRFLETA